MNKLSKSLAFTAVAATLGLGGTSALAGSVFADFTVDATAYGAPSTFVADKITGNYSEWITFSDTDGDLIPDAFDVSIKWEAGQFVADDGNTPLNSGGPNGTRLGFTYGLYALFQGSGTVVVGPTNTFTLDPGGSLALYIDPNLNTLLVNPISLEGKNPWTTSGTTGDDDILFATGVGLFGSGSLNTTCSGGINCGSFGQTTSFVLEDPDGKNFFTAPDPFYDLSFQSGQFTSFVVTGTQQINGSLDVVFSRVPEPASLALLGVGLLGLGFARRRAAA